VDRVRGLQVDFICVAYSPGKLVRSDTVATAYTIKQRVGTDVVFNLATRDMNKLALGGHLLGAQMLGLENAVVLQGDPFNARELEQVRPVDDFTPTGLVGAISALNDGLDHRGAKLGMPTDFCIGATLDLGRDLDREARLAWRKVEAGANFFITQPFYDPDRRRRFLDLYQAAASEPLSAPVFWGLQVLEKDGVLLGEIPDRMTQELEKGRPGTDIAVEQLGALVDAGVRGVYLVPPILKGGVRDYEAAQRVLEQFRD
jgi:homocysteine S-methyltransferase